MKTFFLRFKEESEFRLLLLHSHSPILHLKPSCSRFVRSVDLVMNHTGSFSFFVLVHCSRLLDVLVMTAGDSAHVGLFLGTILRTGNATGIPFLVPVVHHQDGAWIKTGVGL